MRNAELCWRNVLNVIDLHGQRELFIVLLNIHCMMVQVKVTLDLPQTNVLQDELFLIEVMKLDFTFT
jgi:hypothetical protein